MGQGNFLASSFSDKSGTERKFAYALSGRGYTSFFQKESMHMSWREKAGQSFRYTSMAMKMPEKLVIELSWIMPCVSLQNSVIR